MINLKNILYILLFGLSINNEIGNQAPTFFLSDLNNKDFFLSRELEKEEPILINFFATYCEPCKRELPLIDSLMNVYNGINTYYINVGSKRRPEKPEYVSMFTNILKLSHPILLDRYGMVFKKYSETQVLPLTVIIDSQGKIIYSKDGYDEDTINQLGEVINKNIKKESLYNVQE